METVDRIQRGSAYAGFADRLKAAGRELHKKIPPAKLREYFEKDEQKPRE